MPWFGEPRYARHFSNKGSTMDPPDVHWATGGLTRERLNILQSLTFSLSLLLQYYHCGEGCSR